MDGLFVGWITEVDIILEGLVGVLNKAIDNAILINISI